jgi:hypothetical protein
MPTPSAPYPLRRGLVERNRSSELVEAVPAETSGEGNGVRVVEGRCNVDPLGVRMGEECADVGFVLRIGVAWPGRSAVCIRNAFVSRSIFWGGNC